MPVHGTEFLVLILLAFIILGPKQLPEYAAKLARVVVKARRLANDAKVQLKAPVRPASNRQAGAPGATGRRLLDRRQARCRGLVGRDLVGACRSGRRAQRHALGP